MGLEEKLSGSPYEPFSVDPHQEANPFLFYRGGEPLMADVRDSWGILRRVLMDDGRQLTFEEFLRRLIHEPPRIYQLHAGASEGKTTFIRQMAYHLHLMGSTPLRWFRPAINDNPLIRELKEVYSLKPVVLVELEPTILSYHVAEMKESLRMLCCPVLVAGPLYQIRDCWIKGATERLQFSHGCSADEIQKLVTDLTRIAASADKNGWNIKDGLPNLTAFLKDSHKEDYFVGSNGPELLIVALLKAVYGRDFPRRFAEDYHHLSTTDQLVFRTVAYVRAVGVPLPRRFLLSIVSDTTANRESVDGLCKKCWLIPYSSLTGEEYIKTSNTVISAATLQGADLYSGRPFTSFLDALFTSASRGIDWQLFVRSVVRQYSLWSPVFQTAYPNVKKHLFQEVRKALRTHNAWIALAREAADKAQDWPGALTWSSTMYHLLPEQKRGKRAKHLTVLDRLTLALDRAEAKGELSAPDHRRLANVALATRAAKDPRVVFDEKLHGKTITQAEHGWLLSMLTSHAEYFTDEIAKWLAIARRYCPREMDAVVEYLEAKVDLSRAERAADREKVRPLVLQKWLKLRGKAGLELDFYHDLAHAAAEEARAGNTSKNTSIEIAIEAYEDLLARLPDDSRAQEYGGFLDETLSPLTREQQIHFLRKAWKTSLNRGESNQRTGTKLAQLLLDTKDPGKLSEAIGVSQAILETHNWGRALLLVARQAATRPELTQYVLDKLKSGIMSAPDRPINKALLLLAAATVEKDEGLRVTYLRQACGEFDLEASSATPPPLSEDACKDFKEAAEALPDADEEKIRWLRRAEEVRVGIEKKKPSSKLMKASEMTVI